jgi:hypothetical protein
VIAPTADLMIGRLPARRAAEAAHAARGGSGDGRAGRDSFRRDLAAGEAPQRRWRRVGPDGFAAFHGLVAAVGEGWATAPGRGRDARGGGRP